ncbi:UDP-3-O-(3-hydroxymyristoyl)glucosamine N-acyltransferase [Candidatus Latescibacterota bacterium]
MTCSLEVICKAIGASAPDHSERVEITGVSSIEDACSGEICFLSNPRYTKYLETTNASAVIVSKDTTVPERVIALYVDDPYVAFVKLLEFFNVRSDVDIASGIDSLSSIHPDAQLGANVSVGPFAVIGAGVSIGDGTVIGSCTVIMKDSSVGSGCILYPNVTIMDRCSVGNGVILHAGVVIGADGFGFAPVDGGLHKIPQIGKVVIEENVEIGANTCIDRATFGTTIIERGAKIDNLIQIGHNVKVGQCTVIASQAGISGSTSIGNGVRIGGQVGMAGHLNVGDGSSVGAQAGVTKDVPPGETVSGYPAKNHMKAMRLEAALRRLPELHKIVKAQERRIQELEKIIQERR